jgi:hypothetical protein
MFKKMNYFIILKMFFVRLSKSLVKIILLIPYLIPLVNYICYLLRFYRVGYVCFNNMLKISVTKHLGKFFKTS